MMVEKQFVGEADSLSLNITANLLSATHPMYERPQVVDGPYAPIKPKKGQKGIDDFLPDDSEMARKAEYEDLKRRLEAAYRLRFDGQPKRTISYARCVCKNESSLRLAPKKI